MAQAEKGALGRNPDVAYPSGLARTYADAFPSSDVVATEVSLRVYAAYDAQVLAVERMLSSAGPVRSMARYRVLRCLLFSEQGYKNQAEIMNELGVSSANITRLVDALEKSELIQRYPHPTDRRITYVKLTDSGKEAASIMAAAMVQFMEDMCRGFSDKDKARFCAQLLKFQKNANDSLTERKD